MGEGRVQKDQIRQDFERSLIGSPAGIWFSLKVKRNVNLIRAAVQENSQQAQKPLQAKTPPPQCRNSLPKGENMQIYTSLCASYLPPTNSSNFDQESTPGKEDVSFSSSWPQFRHSQSSTWGKRGGRKSPLRFWPCL